MKNKVNIISVLALLTAFAQVLLILYWGSRRENYYWDEYYSFEKTHYLTSTTPGEHYISEDPLFKMNEWIPVSIVNDTISIKKSESVLCDPPDFLFKRIVGYNSPFVLVNLLAALFFEGIVSIWPFIIANIIYLIINQLLLYVLALKIGKNSRFALATISFYGFSSICMSMGTFARFYIFATLMTTCFVLFHFLYWECDKKHIILRGLYIALAFVPLLIGVQNAQFMIIFGGFFVLAFLIVLLAKKKDKFAFYAIPVCAGGLWYILFKTDYISILTDFSHALETTSGALTWALETIAATRIEMIPGRIVDMGILVGRYMFGSVYFMLLVMAIILGALVLLLIRKRQGGSNIYLQDDYAFMYAVAIAVGFFLTFFTVFGLYEQIRYISFIFPMCAMTMIWIIMALFNDDKAKILVVVLIIVQIAAVNIKGKVDMLYLGNRERIENIRSENAKSLMLYAGTHIDHITYQSTLFCDNDAEFFVYDGVDLEKAENAFRDDMMVVMYNSSHNEDFERMIEEKGYTLEQVGWTYQLSAYKLVPIS